MHTHWHSRVKRFLGCASVLGAAWVVGLSLAPAQALRSSSSAEQLPASPAALSAPAYATARAMTARIDGALSAAWADGGVEPAAVADDAEFLRRAHLDLAGKIPSVAEVRKFLADQRLDKRERLVDEQLEGAIFAAHFANLWREMLLAGTNPELRMGVAELESWLRLRFAAGTPYNQLVAELVASAVPARSRSAQPLAVTVPSPLAFFQANERKPENLAARLSKVFLGVNVECAQCHDHPFAKWRQDDFWSFAAFFRGMDGPSSDMAVIALADSRDRTGLPIPGTETVAMPRFLDGSLPAWQADSGNRAMLAWWMTRAENPFFARAAVNRVWEQFFGRSLSTPDGGGTAGPAGHAELLDALAEQFVAARFDLKQLIRGIVLSRTYQLSSRGAADDGRTGQFALMPVRRMTGDQLFDSLVQATGFYEPPPPRAAQPLAAPSVRADFRNKFADEGSERGDSQTSIVQALALMNGKLIGDATSIENSRTLKAVVKLPLVDTAERLEMLFLATVGRPPSAEERAKFLAYIEDGELAPRLADVFWVLLNSAEFASNH
jgi:Protein of unknown function (DUF1549)/Protein of unknown function (DUF1553)